MIYTIEIIKKNFSFLILNITGFLFLVFNASYAKEPNGIAVDYGVDLQNPVTSVAKDVYNMHVFVTIIMALITLFVLGLLIWVCYRYSASRNNKPSKTVHNTLVEILWTAIPVVILIVIAIPSFKLLYKQDVVPEPDLTIKAIGYQWYWGYEYPDNGNFTYEAFMVQSAEELEEDKPYKRMLTTDTKVVVPVNKIIRMQVTAADVLQLGCSRFWSEN